VSAIHLIRHAKAKNRLDWKERDDLRPLTKRGRRQAEALGERLRDEPLARLLSSPFVRCVQTLEPLAVAADLPIETTDLLAEGAGAESALSLLLSLAGEGPIACCTHGDVVFDVVRTVASSGVALAGPFDVPVAGTWIFDVDDGRVADGRFVERPPR
jgi:8-oxo-dGTP diphosphatase